MKLKSFEFSLFGVNTYILWDEATREAAIVDPAMTRADECAWLDEFIASNGLKLVHLINTHLHLDHTFGDEHIMARYGLPIEAHANDRTLGLTRQAQADKFHLPLRLPPVEIDVELNDGDIVTVGNERLRVICVPGHSQGSIALYDEKDAFVLTGDALFQGSIGRTDLPGGNHAQLVNAITDRLLTLPPHTRVYPGHGPASTIADEMRHNPYL